MERPCHRLILNLSRRESFAAFATFLGTPLPENPIEALRILRREAAAEVERLIAFLDALGGDPDLEDGGDDEEEPDEPSLGWTTTFNQTSRNRLGGTGDEEQDDADREPSLGSRSAINQLLWADGSTKDFEDEHDGREPDVDDEDGHDTEGGTSSFSKRGKKSSRRPSFMLRLARRARQVAAEWGAAVCERFWVNKLMPSRLRP